MTRVSQLCAVIALAVPALLAPGDIVVRNASSPLNNAAMLAAWMGDCGITAPRHTVDFEVGFTNGQNISGVPGLFPDGLLVADTSSAHAAVVRSGAGVINGSNPIGVFALTHNELPYLELDFSARPVDYVAFYDIDHTGTRIVVEFTNGATTTFSIDGTGSGGNIEEFTGIWRNDRPPIRVVRMDSSGDGRWGIDNLMYGRACPADVDGDGFVTGDDFQLFVEWFETGDIRADFDGDGFITGDDFEQFVTAFEAGC